MIDDTLSPGKRIMVSQVIRWKQALTSVKEDHPYRSPFTVHVAPNPLSGHGLMRFSFTQNEHAESMCEDAYTDVALYSALGVNVGVWRIGSEGIISLPGLTAGVYQVRAMRDGHTSYTSIVVAE